MGLPEEFFERDLSAQEADALEAQLLASPEAAEALLERARASYQATGLPEPSWNQRPRRGRLPKAWLWAGVVVLAAGLAAFSVQRTRARVLEVQESDEAFALAPTPLAEAEPTPAAAVPDAAGEPASPAEPAAAGQAEPGPARQGKRLGIPLRMAHAGSARAEVLDAQGRLVRTVYDGPLTAGFQRLGWDGKDDGGRVVAAGTYSVVIHHDGLVQRSQLQVRSK